ncbi:MAG: aspartate--tRNA(Asn) ligase [Candidatus Pacebacteria bacterium]|nr:aspartate--tRNA(Asn) ligase [Candidatus Paceibacterota bacterium]
MKKIYINQTPEYIGKKITISAWIDTRRDHGKVVFLDLKDKSGILQAVGQCLGKEFQPQCVIQVQGKIKQRPEKMQNKKLETGKIELEIETIKLLTESEPFPFDINDKLTLPILLDYRPITLRNPKIRAIFKIEEGITESFRKNMRALDFTEFHAPAIVPSTTEGGAEVFSLDYYNSKAYLAQSPQLYKQIMVGVFERVFTVAHAYRAEPSVTTRHIAEYVSLDAEMGFIDSWKDIMEVCEKLIKNILNDLEKNYKKELKIFLATIPEIKGKIPVLTLQEALDILYKLTKKDQRNEPDLDPEGEKEICQYIKEKYGSDFVFITHFPVSKRPFYTFPDPENPKLTLSFDILCRGLEIVTGGQRINDYKKLLENIKKWGNNPETFSFYLQAFKYGMPPEGGFALGLERMVKQILGLENIREAIPFPRDMQRIDQRLYKND